MPLPLFSTVLKSRTHGLQNGFHPERLFQPSYRARNATARTRLLIGMRGGKNAPDTSAGQDVASSSNPITGAGETNIHDDEIGFVGQRYSNRILSRIYDINNIVTLIGQTIFDLNRQEDFVLDHKSPSSRLNESLALSRFSQET